MISDEVVTGFGRSGCMLGSRGWGVKPDILCLAKGISAGYIPLGTVFNKRISDAIENSQSFASMIMHGYTYSGHPVACAYLNAKLQPLAQKYAAVGEVRGKGLMLAIDLVKDKTTREPVNPMEGYAIQVGDITKNNGVLVRTVGTKIILSPPLTLIESEGDKIALSLDIAFQKAP